MTALLEKHGFESPYVLAPGSTSYLESDDDEILDLGLVEHQAAPAKGLPVRVIYGTSQNTVSATANTVVTPRASYSNLGKWQATSHLHVALYDFPSRADYAFTALDLLRSDDELFKEAVEKLRASQEILHREAICERLLRLLDLYQEDYDGRALSADSLASFIAFLRDRPTVRRPSIAATPAGNLYAIWKEGTGQKLVLHFLPGARCRYAASVRNAMHEARFDEHSGSTTADSVSRSIDALGIASWIDE
ncbi:hypothetical protein [Burkholderia cepacia]|uniref:Uncharacterized protein n=1 Tax=Burkholderia cepacia TaxID=292 RepID=A0ABM6NUK8_BURCE|nr:hypothetical protein [Burkholderia cepacia]AIO22683.1 hypothetical protein DM41_1198 [Burkholderia cepacia ATCC 25416]ALK16978.1 hypothetical protein APZ15_03615 [Burkholderia cepacia ATCC 25416]ASE94400.1 hypothetical protein CEQ23_12820 [Burkholderia cepacia]ATF77425.1 hypothetical protein CO711_08165 [Burkholderia cepacia]MCA8470394.1 hypothetical protein [Burkholderia cepacia]